MALSSAGRAHMALLVCPEAGSLGMVGMVEESVSAASPGMMASGQQTSHVQPGEPGPVLQGHSRLCGLQPASPGRHMASLHPLESMVISPSGHLAFMKDES